MDLFDAVKDGDLERVKKLLKKPNIFKKLFKKSNINPTIDVNHADSVGSTPLSVAAENGELEIVKFLLTVPGIDVNKGDNHETTPLYYAAKSGHHEIVRLLITVPGIDVNQATTGGETPLYAVADARRGDARRGDPKIVKLLLTVPGIDVNKATIKDGETPLYAAASRDHPNIVKLLLAKSGIDVNKATIKDGKTPFDIAIEKKNREVINNFFKYNNKIPEYIKTLIDNSEHSSPKSNQVFTPEDVLSTKTPARFHRTNLANLTKIIPKGLLTDIEDFMIKESSAGGNTTRKRKTAGKKRKTAGKKRTKKY